MNTTTMLLLATVLAAPLAIGQQTPPLQSTQAQAQAACLAALPPAPKPPPPPARPLFPGLQEKIDQQIRRAGGDPDAMRAAAAQAAQQKYQDKMQAWNKKRSACYATPVPAAGTGAPTLTPGTTLPQSATPQKPQ